MAYQALTVHLLISAPSDVESADMHAVQQTINQWNFGVGRRFTPQPVTVIPVSWTANSYSVFGVRPQQTLNEQLVDHADLALVMFADRLGTPTGEADSGTLEELDRMLAAGKPVSVVRSEAPRSSTGVSAAKEKLRLEEWLQHVYEGRTGLVSSYSDTRTLAVLVTNMLSEQATRFLALGATGQPSGEDSADALWPRIESADQMIADSDGSLRTARMWKLIIENKAKKLARDVRFQFEAPDGRPSRQFDDRYAYDFIEILPAGGSQEFPLRVTPRQSGQAICVITWTDDRGERETRATVRTF